VRGYRDQKGSRGEEFGEEFGFHGVVLCRKFNSFLLLFFLLFFISSLLFFQKSIKDASLS